MRSRRDQSVGCFCASFCVELFYWVKNIIKYYQQNAITNLSNELCTFEVLWSAIVPKKKKKRKEKKYMPTTCMYVE